MNYAAIARSIRSNILAMHYHSQASHIGSALSCVDILVSLYCAVLHIDPSNPNMDDRDRFIFSKGHAASALYATLAHKGFFEKEILNTYCHDGSCLPGHITKDSVPGIEVSTGSLGHGLSIGCGMALALRTDSIPSKVFVLLSDGECDEGSVWEAALFAGHHALDNVVAIIDYNKLQALGRVEEVLQLEPLKDKWMSFGWAVKEMNGHAHDEIIDTLRHAPFERNRPSVVIAHTIKGKGVSFMENQVAWHYKAPNEMEYKQALEELQRS